MEPRRRRRRRRYTNKISAFGCCICALLFSICALLSTVLCNGSSRTVLETRSSSTDFSPNQGAGSRRQLVAGGPGSFPPRCSAKCGRCAPCYPVHVPVPPGTPVVAEYYPEAWRCKCGDRLYMP